MGNRPQHLSFVYVKDVAQAAIKALTGSVKNTSYNVSDGQSYDRYALANVTKRLLGIRTLRIHMPLTIIRWVATMAEATSSGMPLLNRDRLNELTAQNWNCSIIRIKKELGYQPDFSLEEGMRATLDWYTGNNWL
jgi:nucleoside-diphosphate-sugar epimerase